jgi:Ni/Fe-hydrogenase 1 B-type cytochrome subunit
METADRIPIIAEPKPGNLPVESVAVDPRIAVLPSLGYRRIYVWEVPVRIFHWINAGSLLVLAATGLLIGNPLSIFQAEEAYQQYWFAWVRFLHFAAGYIFFFNLLYRVYWAFVGNEFARWSNYVPYRKQQFVDLWETVRVDIIQLDLKGKIAIGHNYMAAFTYFGLLFVSLFMVVTGFGLYSSMSESYLPKLFTWIVPLMGGDANVRWWHHLLMWSFFVFTVIHVYLCFFHDYVEGRGTISSIVDGWKFVKEDEIRN